jgi:hypothetical protein
MRIHCARFETEDRPQRRRGERRQKRQGNPANGGSGFRLEVVLVVRRTCSLPKFASRLALSVSLAQFPTMDSATKWQHESCNLAKQRISNPSVGCSSHPGRAAPFWGTIQKNAALVDQRLCFVNNLQRDPCSCRGIARANDRLPSP